MSASYSETGIWPIDQLIAGNAQLLMSAKRTLAAGDLVRGSVLGTDRTSQTATISAKTGNTGNAALTGTTVTPGRAAQPGRYVLLGTGKTATAGAVTPAANVGNTGSTGTIASATATTGCQVGVYRVTCVEAVADHARFIVEDPNGVFVGQAVEQVEFSNQVVFTITNSTGDFVAGDGFTLTVAAALANNTGAFTVRAPDGALVGTAYVGIAFASDHFAVTIPDGDTDWASGDELYVDIADDGDVRLSVANAIDGSAVPDGILADDTDASSAPVSCLVYTAGDFNSRALTFGTGHTAASCRPAMKRAGIRLIDSLEANHG